LDLWSTEISDTTVSDDFFSIKTERQSALRKEGASRHIKGVTASMNAWRETGIRSLTPDVVFFA
jgi:hypothetical protein